MAVTFNPEDTMYHIAVYVRNCEPFYVGTDHATEAFCYAREQCAQNTQTTVSVWREHAIHVFENPTDDYGNANVTYHCVAVDTPLSRIDTIAADLDFFRYTQPISR